MAAHPVHSALVTRVQPLLEIGFVFLELDPCEPNILKAQLGRPVAYGIDYFTVLFVFHRNIVTDRGLTKVHSAYE